MMNIENMRTTVLARSGEVAEFWGNNPSAGRFAVVLATGMGAMGLESHAAGIELSRNNKQEIQI